MSSNPFLHFALGADMSPRIMQALCPQAKLVGAARIDGFQLGFFDHSKVWDGGELAPVPAPGGVLWGVLYDVCAAELDRLDMAADVREDGSGTRFRYPVIAVDKAGVKHDALIYRKDQTARAQPPSTEFLGLLVREAEAHQFPADYVAALRAIESRPASFRVPAAVMPRGRLAACEACSVPATGAERPADAAPGSASPSEPTGR
jgi:hypothetical protein